MRVVTKSRHRADRTLRRILIHIPRGREQPLPHRENPACRAGERYSSPLIKGQDGSRVGTGGTPLEDCGRGFARLLALPRLELPGFAFGYAVAGFVPNQG